jgi:2-C-methyl-D-erythritol 4-phosphate cytidylyltransferase
VSAGAGTRLGAGEPKALVRLGSFEGSELVAVSVRRLLACGVQRIVLVVPRGAAERFRQVGLDLSRVDLIDGGDTRAHSVKNGLDYLRRSNLIARPEETLIAIHDAARPFFGTLVFQQLRERAAQMGAAVPAALMVDAVCTATDHGAIERYEPRDRLKAVQTPQVFRYGLIIRAHAHAHDGSGEALDDASLVVRFHQVALVESSAENFKVTTPGDLERARMVFAALGALA